MDNLTKTERSRVMSKVRSKNTKPELMVRKKLFSLGFRYRLFQKIPGTPDLTLKKFKTAIFIHGCFWHNHQGCKLNRLPKDHRSFWQNKKSRNQLHDLQVRSQLIQAGWRVIVVWECACKKSKLNELAKLITEFLHDSSCQFKEISANDLENQPHTESRNPR